MNNIIFTRTAGAYSPTGRCLSRTDSEFYKIQSAAQRLEPVRMTVCYLFSMGKQFSQLYATLSQYLNACAVRVQRPAFRHAMTTNVSLRGGPMLLAVSRRGVFTILGRSAGNGKGAFLESCSTAFGTTHAFTIYEIGFTMVENSFSIMDVRPQAPQNHFLTRARFWFVSENFHQNSMHPRQSYN